MLGMGGVLWHELDGRQVASGRPWAPVADRGGRRRGAQRRAAASDRPWPPPPDAWRAKHLPLARHSARWRSGYAAACKAVYMSSILIRALVRDPRFGGGLVRFGARSAGTPDASVTEDPACSGRPVGRAAAPRPQTGRLADALPRPI